MKIKTKAFITPRERPRKELSLLAMGILFNIADIVFKRSLVVSFIVKNRTIKMIIVVIALGILLTENRSAIFEMLSFVWAFVIFPIISLKSERLSMALTTKGVDLNDK